MIRQDIQPISDTELKELTQYLADLNVPPDTPLQPEVQTVFGITQKEFLAACVITTIVTMLFLR